MKKMIVAAAMLLMAGMTSAYAEKGGGGNEAAVKSLNKDFASAKNVQWEQSKDYLKASFTINNQVLFAFYNSNGELQSVMRNIVSEQLPLSLLRNLKSGYGDYWITDLYEIAADGHTSYYVTLENPDTKLVLKSNSEYNWTESAKTLKDAVQ
ncbi:MAG: hypothetical protein P4L51_22335 [Puia sp.]|nr:hypothetical protein [Puia sp.]